MDSAVLTDFYCMARQKKLYSNCQLSYELPVNKCIVCGTPLDCTITIMEIKFIKKCDS